MYVSLIYIKEHIMMKLVIVLQHLQIFFLGSIKQEAAVLKNGANEVP